MTGGGKTVDRHPEPCYLKFTSKGVVGVYARPGQHTEEIALLAGPEMMRLACPRGRVGLFLLRR